MLLPLSNFSAGEDVVDSAEIYEREEQKYVAEEKDFTQPQYFIAEEVKCCNIWLILLIVGNKIRRILIT